MNLAQLNSTSRLPLLVPWCLIGLLLPAIGEASDFRETARFRDVAKQVQRYVTHYGAERVLLVMDVDNTLLAMDEDLGSDQWFEWQSFLLDHQPDSHHLVARNFEELLAVQGLLFAITPMHPPEARQPKLLADLQQSGVATMVLTSRGEEFRSATQREFRRNGYDFTTSMPSIRLLYRNGEELTETASRFTPYDVDHPRASGLTPEEITRFGLNAAPRQVGYGDGLLMVAGQHKGAMLLVLLHLTDRPWDAIVFVDDHERHGQYVADALGGRGIENTIFHYQREDARVQRFRDGNKRAVTRRWRKIDRALRFSPVVVELPPRHHDHEATHATPGP